MAIATPEQPRLENLVNPFLYLQTKSLLFIIIREPLPVPRAQGVGQKGKGITAPRVQRVLFP